ncbi:MAG: hypothetical protein HQL32_04070 [Planctomycetes bacterium]|nr:hypothetical protein [Planctomycetota bacterium]
MIRNICNIGILALVLATIGCSTTSTGPTLAGKNTYVISRQEGAFPTGKKPLLQEALAEAMAFCENQGKEMELISTHENQGPYILHNYPKATVTFKAVDKVELKK